MVRLFFASLLATVVLCQVPAVAHVSPGANPILMEKGVGERRFNDLKKGPLIVNFWASWCGYCVEELPSLDQLALKMRQKGGDVVVILVEPTTQGGSRCFEKKGIRNLKLYHDHQGEVAKAFQALHGGLPFTVFLDATGKEVFRHRGFVDWNCSDAASKIQKHLGLKL